VWVNNIEYLISIFLYRGCKVHNFIKLVQLFQKPLNMGSNQYVDRNILILKEHRDFKIIFIYWLEKGMYESLIQIQK